MNKLMTRIMRDQRGQVLAIVLIMLLVGSLLLPAVLSLVSTGIAATKQTELRVDQLYGADTGVERAIYWLKNTDPLLYPGPEPRPPNLPPHQFGLISIKDNKVFAFIEFVSKVDNVTTFKITSYGGPNVIADMAVAHQTSPFVEIVSYISDITLDFSGITESNITTPGTINTKPGDVITPPEGEPHGPVAGYDGPWPDADYLKDFYMTTGVREAPHYHSGTYTVTGTPSTEGPFYRGGTLDIGATSSGKTLKLMDTMYITGDTLIGSTNQDFTLDLNGQVLFVESPTVASGPGGPYALVLGGKVTIKGSGCIIAVGDIDFQPNIETNPSNYVLVLSINGKTRMHPLSTFYGTLAGFSYVDLLPGVGITYTTPPPGLNFPGLGSGRYWGVYSWEIFTH